ncbi:MAG: hypothetical protein AB1668_00140 [Nanoarchaeota archaeon]
MALNRQSKVAIFIAALAAPSAIATCSQKNNISPDEGDQQIRCLEDICTESSSDAHPSKDGYWIGLPVDSHSVNSESVDSGLPANYHQVGKPTDNVPYLDPNKMNQDTLNQVQVSSEGPKDGGKKEKDAGKNPQDSGVDGDGGKISEAGIDSGAADAESGDADGDAENDAGGCIYQTYFSGNIPPLKTDKGSEFNQKVSEFSLTLENEAYVITGQYLDIYGVNHDVLWKLISANQQSADLFDTGGRFSISGKYKVPKSATIDWGLADGNGNTIALYSTSNISDKLEPFSVVIEIDKNSQKARFSADNGNSFEPDKDISSLAGHYYLCIKGTGISDGKFYSLQSLEFCKQN